MKFALTLALALLSTFTVASHGIVDHHRRRQQCNTNNMPIGSNPSDNTAGWVQKPEGKASFTVYEGCGNPSCGGTVNGYSAAVNTLAFGADISFGDACGRCFKITATGDPYTPSFKGPFHSIVVKVNDLCPHSPHGSPKSWCDQRVSDPLNQFKMPMHFDLCQESGAPSAFFPAGRGAMIGTYKEVSCDKWTGDKCPVPRWDNWCMAKTGSPLWPKQACGNIAIPAGLK